MNQEDNHQYKEQKEIKDQKNLLEWGVFWVSLLLVLAVIGYLSYQVYTYTPSFPELQVVIQPKPTSHQPNRYHVVVHNHGAVTAGSVKVELVMQEKGEEIEKAELEMMFVPQQSSREAWVNFTNKPTNKNSVSAHVVSYQKP